MSLSITQTEDGLYDIQVYKADGVTGQDLTEGGAWTLHFRLKERSSDVGFKVELDSGSGITHDADQTTNPGLAQMEIPSATSATLNLPDHKYWFYLMTPAGKKHYMVSGDKFEVNRYEGV